MFGPVSKGHYQLVPSGHHHFTEGSSAHLPSSAKIHYVSGVHRKVSQDGSDDAPPKRYSQEDMQREWVCGVGYEVRQLKDLDCVAQRFFCDFSLYLKWFNPELARYENFDKITAAQANRPDVFIANATDVALRDENLTREEGDPPGVLLVELTFTGVLTEFMELQLFPLDAQDLTIAVRFKDDRWRVRCLGDNRYTRISQTVELAEWTIYEPQVFGTRDDVLGYLTWELKMKVCRKSEFYLWNVVFMVGGIASLTFFSFLFGACEWEQRSSYSATLLLTSVAFKFVVAGSLPKVSFFTVLDVYLFAAFVIMVVIIVEAAFVKMLHLMDVLSLERLRHVDVTIGSLLFVMWIFANTIFISRFHTMQAKQKEKLGPLLPFITTNKRIKGAMTYLLNADVNEAEEGKDETNTARSSLAGSFLSNRLTRRANLS